jgi:hypothetical protein
MGIGRIFSARSTLKQPKNEIKYTPASKRIFSGKSHIPRPSRQCIDVFDETYQIAKFKSNPQVIEERAAMEQNFKITFGMDFNRIDRSSPRFRKDASPNFKNASPIKEISPVKRFEID